MPEFDGRTVVITGGGGGIGSALARRFAEEGARLALLDVDAERLEAVRLELEAAGHEVLARECDLTRPEACRAAFAAIEERFGGVDVLVNNATPAGGTARLEKMSDEAMQAHVDVNYLAVFQAMQAVFPHMKAAARGRIVTMCSLNGINAHRYTAMYNASKEAARALTRTAAVEWGRYGITANVVCPFAASPAWDGFERFDR